MLTPERLKAIKARCERATEGPWRWDDTPWGEGASLVAVGQHNEFGLPLVLLDDGSAAGEYAPNKATEADREFIAHAREDVPALVEEVERLHGFLRELRKRVGHWRLEARNLRRNTEDAGYAEERDWLYGKADGLEDAADQLEAMLNKLEAKQHAQ